MALPFRVAEPLVRATLANFLEAERGENGDDLPRLENGNLRHPRSHHHGLRADILANHPGHAVFQD